ncbi:RagB/SusD family nutrient uptake outer membrane protein [uncultured Polaribacter sp.]|uniref:RagB/SusD family nutrient uptake outer membrane protein n=1 Tax=uncultured Polaribacter sp. TaxID=174711 RepID=UPI0026306534|nr:RagB/SusD family nutrient uptake outer membrane protein [uncultured Polaribacter sp.]
MKNINAIITNVFKTVLRSNYYLFFALVLSLMMACEDFLEIDPPTTQVISESVFANEASATSAVNGIYSLMLSSSYGSGGLRSIGFLGGLSADELLYTSASSGNPEFTRFNANSLLSINNFIWNSFWLDAYNIIYNANSVIDGVNNSSDITQSVADLLIGESKFVRAYHHFYMTNVFGDVPLAISTDVDANSNRTRDAVALVYEEIVQDLLDAYELLEEEYVTTERVRPNKSTAAALLARVYLYLGNWDDAETWATRVIDNPNYTLVSDLNGVFLTNNNEAIWQLKSNNPTGEVNEADLYVLINGLSIAVLSENLLDTFEAGDLRKDNWVSSITVEGIDYFFPFKYKNLDAPGEYSTVFRLAEQYLIRAEARAQLNDFSGAQEDLNQIRNRAGLGNTTATTQSSLLLAIEQERFVELFTEFGHRWLDLKRTNRADAVLSGISTKDWQPTDVLYPIPELEREINPNLTQNPGY